MDPQWLNLGSTSATLSHLDCSNKLTGTIPSRWGSPSAHAPNVQDRCLWGPGVQLWLHNNLLQGPVPCGEVRRRCCSCAEGWLPLWLRRLTPPASAPPQLLLHHSTPAPGRPKWSCGPATRSCAARNRKAAGGSRNVLCQASPLKARPLQTYIASYSQRSCRLARTALPVAPAASAARTWQWCCPARRCWRPRLQQQHCECGGGGAPLQRLCWRSFDKAANRSGAAASSPWRQQARQSRQRWSMPGWSARTRRLLLPGRSSSIPQQQQQQLQSGQQPRGDCRHGACSCRPVTLQ